MAVGQSGNALFLTEVLPELALTMTNSGSHTSLFTTNLSPTLTRSLGTHLPEISGIQNQEADLNWGSITTSRECFKSGFRPIS
jgi:hypothetical protein